MKSRKLIAVATAFATVAVAMCFSNGIVHGQSNIYNAYPTGILPSNISSELARVLREVKGIEAEALKQWKALPPPTVTGPPPILQHSGQASVEILGKLMNFDSTISPNENYACASCHMPYVA